MKVDDRMITASPLLNRFVRAAVMVIGLVMIFQRGGGAAEPLFRRDSESCMGTKWHIALYADDESAANRAFQLAWQEIHAIDKCLTNYSSDSELNKFCNTGPHSDFVEVSEHLWTVLQASNKLSVESNGYFDVTVGPISKLWRKARRDTALPDAEKLATARQLVDYRFVEFGEERNTRISKANIKIDLGGIAKGYAVDRAVVALREAGIVSALVNGGGDLAALGGQWKANRWTEGWCVKLAGVESNDPERSFALTNCALATSGDAWQYLEIDGMRYSHIIDPKTGLGSTERRTVSVIAPSCMQADALASALTLMPLDAGIKLAKAKRGIELMITQVKDTTPTVTATEGFPAPTK